MEHHLRQQLLRYLQLYLSKKLNMNQIFVRIISQLKSDEKMSEKQFGSLIKFLEREPQFVSMNRSEIRSYFDPLIIPKLTKEKKFVSNLNEFLR